MAGDPIVDVERTEDGVTVTTLSGRREDFDADKAISRFETNVDFYAEMFGSAVNLMVETSRKDNALE